MSKRRRKRRPYLTNRWLETPPGRALVEDLGTANDRVVAEYHGVGQAQVTKLRNRLGVPSHTEQRLTGAVRPRAPKAQEPEEAAKEPRDAEVVNGHAADVVTDELPSRRRGIWVPMSADEMAALDLLAEAQCRTRDGQARWLVLQALHREGLRVAKGGEA